LAGRKTVGKINGDIRFGGLVPTVQFQRRYTGYVEQFDTLIGALTVQEMVSVINYGPLHLCKTRFV
jgi:ATP-binding cassette, subfamily G (WHITE), member 2